MNDKNKTKQELISELAEMRQRIADLEASETKHKRIEKTPTEAKEQYRRLMELCPETIAIHSQGKIVYMNPAGAKLLGVAKSEELIGKSIMDFVPPDYQKIIKKRIRQGFEQGKPAPLIEEKLVRPDGKVIFVETIATPITYQGKPAMLAMSRDITERKKAEGALRESEKKYRSLYESSKDGIVPCDIQGNFLDANGAFLDMLGYTIEEVKKLSYQRVTPKKWHETEEDIIKNQVMARGYSDQYEKEYIKKDGTVFPIAIRVWLIKDERGDPTGTWAIVRDITERKEAEEALIRSERLRALGEMAGGVAHDFNNLLAIILGNAQLLERGLKRYKEEEIKKRLKVIARTAYEGGETVRRIQHFTRREVLTENFTRIDLNEIVREAISSTSPRWKDEPEAKGITIKMKEKLEKLPPLLGGRSEIMEVLTNLIFNAVEAMREEGEITIKTKAKEKEVFLYFTDTGQGIPKGIKDKIFDPFFTTKGPKASGLGLSTSYGIIKRHKGEIKVESREGKGTIFTISIPIPLEIPQDEEKLKDLEKFPSRKILVIDDEEGVRDVLEGILKSGGHRVTLAETGQEGLEEFRKTDFNLVLTDLGMPEISGWELAQRIKEIDPDMPVGMITGWGVAFTKEKLKEEGIDFILFKPFDCARVVRKVSATLKSKKR